MNLVNDNTLFLLEEIVKKNFAAKYKGSVLGILWSILKPLLIGFLIGVIAYSLFLESAILVAQESIPGIMESLANYDTFEITYQEMMNIKDVKDLMNIGAIVSIAVGGLITFCLKLKRDFIPVESFFGLVKYLNT